MSSTPFLRDTLDWFEFKAADEDDYYGSLAAKRRDTPVEITRPFRDDSLPVVTAYRYADVVKIVRNEEDFTANVVAVKYRPVLGQRTMTALTNGEQRHLRSVVGAFLSSRRVQSLGEGIVRPVVTDTVRTLLRQGHGDLVHEVAAVVPPLVITRLLGLPDEVAPLLLRNALAVIGYMDDPKAGLRGSRALRKLFGEAIEERRLKPGDDLISLLLATPAGDSPPADEDVIAMLLLLAIAGTETTYPAIGSLFCALLRDDEQLAAVRTAPELMTQAVDEVLRWEAPVQLTCRSAARDVEVGDITAPAGTMVLAHLGSANHDIPEIAEPERFDIHRPGPIPHVSFGLGTHRCLGTHLARLEIALTAATILAECPSLRLAPGCDATISGQAVRGPVSLEVEV
jgi:cytochrome P450